MKDLTHRATKAKHNNIVSVWLINAAALFTVPPEMKLNKDGKPLIAAPIKPSNPTSTAACIACIFKLSFTWASKPMSAIGKPMNAGIKAVTLTKFVAT